MAFGCLEAEGSFELVIHHVVSLESLGPADIVLGGLISPISRGTVRDL